MSDLITTLHPINDDTTDLYPNVKNENIPPVVSGKDAMEALDGDFSTLHTDEIQVGGENGTLINKDQIATPNKVINLDEIVDDAELAQGLSGKVDKVSGKGLSTNDYTDTDKTLVDTIPDKVDKVQGKGLSTNDYTNEDKAIVGAMPDQIQLIKDNVDALGTAVSGKVDKVSGKGLSTNDFTNADKALVDTIPDKVDKVQGKGLSTNDYTNADKTALEVTIPGELSSLRAHILNLYRMVIRSGDMITVTDASVALASQPFPLTVSPKALLDYVGGMCKKCENLYSQTQIPETGQGYPLALTAGTYTLSLKVKTAGKNAYITLRKNGANVLGVGFVGGYDETSSYTGVASVNFTLTGDADQIFFFNSVNGVDVTDIMLVRGSTAKAYEPYFDGIKTAPVTKVVSKGFNLWDEEWELGGYNSSTGEKVSESDRIRNKNPIAVYPNTNYYFKKGGSGYIYAYYYDKDMNFIGQEEATNSIVTTPSACRYVNFYCSSTYGTTYNHDICINVSNASLNGTYMPYSAPIYYPIHPDIQALDGYGLGKDAEHYNYIDLNRKMFVKETAIDGDDIIVLAEPVEIDISDLLKYTFPTYDIINVLPGGYLEFENENNIGVPYSVTYQSKPNTHVTVLSTAQPTISEVDSNDPTNPL